MNQAPNDRLYQLYRHAFQLLEEQIAFYIKEHYSGVSKIEFSPIQLSGDNFFTMLSITIDPYIYDEFGNKVMLGGRIGRVVYGSYGLLGGISTLDFDVYGNDFIYLSHSNSGEEINVSKHDHLPDEAKLSVDSHIDEIIEVLTENGQLKGISKKEKGSSQAEVIYNLEIVRND
ncbi:hypothetical protein [Streptococcus dentiloxodontae]